MVKIYVSYFWIGFATVSYTLLQWGLSESPPSILSRIEFIFSVSIFCIATGLVLFIKKAAAWIILVAQLGLIPSFINAFILKSRESFNWGTVVDLILILSTTTVYLLTFYWSIQIISNKYIIIDSVKKPIKIMLACLPAAMILTWYFVYTHP
jgi:hypothetical protein